MSPVDAFCGKVGYKKMIEAIIFDLDGVICSTDQYHYKAWKELADELDIPFDEKIMRNLEEYREWKV